MRERPTARRSFAWLARAGYAAQGVLYATVGALAVLVAARGSGSEAGARLVDAAGPLGAEARTTTTRGALVTLGHAPFGRALLVVLAVGLAGYALWRFVQAVWNPEREAPPGAEGLARRAGWFGVAVIHATLVGFALRAALGGGEGPEDRTRPLTARLMAWAPFGPVLVGLGGVALFAYGTHEVWRAWRARLDRELDLRRLPARRVRGIVAVSRVGIAARGVVFAVMGVFLVVAASTSDPAQARGFGDALATLQGWTFGTVLLGAVAAGLVAYGIYDVIEARYRAGFVR